MNQSKLVALGAACAVIAAAMSITTVDEPSNMPLTGGSL
jgi:hypothetical protein